MIAEIQRITGTESDGMGGHVYEWSKINEIEGTLDKLSGDEILANEKISIIATHIFIVFDVFDVTERDRMIIDSMIYRIKDVDNPNNLNRQLEITIEKTGETYEI